MLLEQRAGTTVAEVVINVVEAGAGVAENDAVPGFIVFLQGIQTLVVPHLVPDAVVIVLGVVIVGVDFICLAGVGLDNHGVAGATDPALVIAGSLPASFFLGRNNLGTGPKLLGKQGGCQS